MTGQLELTHVTAQADGDTGRLTLTSAAKRNALSVALVDDMVRGMAHLSDHGVRIAVLDAEPPVFCAGVDLGRPVSAEPGSPDLLLFDALRTTPIFWIASIDGPVLAAGMVLAALCPVSLATERAWFALPELKLGLYPGRVTSFLDALVPRRHLFTYALTGERISAARARDFGLVTQVVESAELPSTERRWLEHLSGAELEFVATARKTWQATFDTPEARTRAVLSDQLLRQNLAGLTGPRSPWNGR